MPSEYALTSKRFSTTTLAALGSPEKHRSPKTFDGIDLDGQTNGDSVNKKLVKDKNRNQKGSISFGNEPVQETLLMSLLNTLLLFLLVFPALDILPIIAWSSFPYCYESIV